MTAEATINTCKRCGRRLYRSSEPDEATCLVHGTQFIVEWKPLLDITQPAPPKKRSRNSPMSEKVAAVMEQKNCPMTANEIAEVTGFTVVHVRDILQYMRRLGEVKHHDQIKPGRYWLTRWVLIKDE